MKEYMNNTDSTDKFTHKAELYTLGRPDYAKEFIDYLFSELGFSNETTVADIGSGTGKLTKQLLQRRCKVFAVEPNDDMRHIAEKELKEFDNFISVKGDASNTTLINNSVDFVTAAQSFHWFNHEEFFLECKRILKPTAKVILIWNCRDEKDELNKEIYQLNKVFCPDFKGFSEGLKEDDETIYSFFSGKYEKLTFKNPIYYREDSFINRLLSSSYALRVDDKKYSLYLEGIKEIFYRYERNGIIKMPNDTVAYIGEVHN